LADHHGQHARVSRFGLNQNFDIITTTKNQDCHHLFQACVNPSNRCTPCHPNHLTSAAPQNNMSRAEDLLLVFAQDEPPPSGSGSRLGTAVIVVCGIISLPTFADI